MTPTRTAAAAWIASLLVAGAACRHARGPAAYLAHRWGIEIVGTRALDRDRVASRVLVRGLDEIDVRAVEELYSSAGYLEAKVEVRKVGDGSGAVRSRIHVTEGRLARVVQLTLDGLDELPEAGSWNAALPLKVGSAFSVEAYELTLRMLTAALRGAGHLDPYVVHAASLDPETLEARVSILVAPGTRGEPYRFGPVFVAGTTRDLVERIRRAAEPLVPRNESFDVTRLEAVRQRVLRVGAFRRVTVEPASADEKRREIPVVVFVQNDG